MFSSDTRIARIAQVCLSLFIGLTIWEIAGWQFNAAHMAPVLGSDFFATRWIAELFAGGVKMEEHPGTIPRLIEFIQEGEFFIALGQSLALFGTGFGIAMVIGLPLGILMARLRLMRIGLESYILGLYATPMAALIPFILAIFGFQFWPKVIVVVLFSVFPILYNTLEGARSLKPEMLEVAKAFRSSERRIWIDILIPYTLPFALTGIRQAIGRALVGMVAAEIFLNNTGLGGWLVDSSRSFDMAGVLGAIIVTTLIGVFLMSLVRRLEKRFAGWRGAAS
ncbi:MAG: ABC transporter permease [Rhodospirillaceae bacterium]|jgi:ABC-type nitrate/sulfonate/bicarbonate transport system permease component|nr:ABC transporter permease [Rhodospirillaceae bacterium]MBT6286708.1 ABC transporter permease [Rhodospirillaceae bacterium]